MKILLVAIGIVIALSLIIQNDPSIRDTAIQKITVSEESRNSTSNKSSEKTKQQTNELETRLAELYSWRVTSSTSPIDDSTNVYMRLISTNDIAGRLGKLGPATMILRCTENTTAAIFRMNDLFLADLQSYGNVIYRIDDEKAKTRRMRESTSNEALGLWRGATAIPFIKSLFGHNELLVQITPYNENPVRATFNISGIEEEIKPLRKACNW